MHVLCQVHVGRILIFICFDCINVFLVSYLKCSSGLPDVFECAFVAFWFVNSTLDIVTCRSVLGQRLGKHVGAETGSR
jgi:hypothetical protein